MGITTKDFLSKLQEIKSEFKIFVPSQKKQASAKPITLKQQKDIISTAVNGVQGSLQFLQTVNDVILENVDGDNFFTIDRVPVILGLRVHCLGTDIRVDADTVGSLEPSLQKIKDVPKFKYTEEVSIDNIVVKIRIPTLKEENVVIKKCIQEVEKLNKEDLSKTVGLVYIFELIKHIESVGIEEDVIDFNELRVIDRIKIVETLPLELYEKITSFYSQSSKYDQSLLTIDDDTVIPMDASLFDAAVDA
jgi:hypothetical protein